MPRLEEGRAAGVLQRRTAPGSPTGELQQQHCHPAAKTVGDLIVEMVVDANTRGNRNHHGPRLASCAAVCDARASPRHPGEPAPVPARQKLLEPGAGCDLTGRRRRRSAAHARGDSQTAATVLGGLTGVLGQRRRPICRLCWSRIRLRLRV